MDQKYPVLNKLKGKITEQGESYRSIAVKTGISLNTLSNKINGYSLFDIIEAAKLCNALKIPPEEIPIFFAVDIAKRNNKYKEETIDERITSI